MKQLKPAFTLVEVNLAIFIMAVGVLAMVSLYSLGFRESRQSEEDVAASGYADAFFAPLVAELSSTNMTWSNWCRIGSDPDSSDAQDYCDAVTQGGKGWAAYVREIGDQKSGLFRVQDCNSLADGVFSEILGKANDSGVSRSMPSQKPANYGLVATRRGGTISLAFRCSRRKDLLLSQPVYYTEVHFQGRGDQ